MLKSKVSHMVAGEAHKLSQAVAEVDWLQATLRDMMVGEKCQ